MRAIASSTTCVCGLATNALRMNPGRSSGCPPSHRPSASSASSASASRSVNGCRSERTMAVRKGSAACVDARRAKRSRVRRMAQVSTSTVPDNGLTIHRVALAGTRALTVLVAFDAGTRTERVEENGMAHFLEHLVFKGGESYPTYRDVNETAERLGGVLNAYTSHDLVAFHITVRAQSAPQAIDLLSDFVGRTRIDAEELDRERGVVIQEINRAYDQPATVAEYLIDRAAFGEHPLGRTVLGPEENLRSFTREGIVAFRERRWSGARGGVFLVGNLEHLPDERELHERFARFPALPEPEPYVPAPEFAPRTLVEERDTNQSHLRMIYRPQVAVRDVRERAALSIYSTLLGGSMGSRLFEEIREK